MVEKESWLPQVVPYHTETDRHIHTYIHTSFLKRKRQNLNVRFRPLALHNLRGEKVSHSISSMSPISFILIGISLYYTVQNPWAGTRIPWHSVLPPADWLQPLLLESAVLCFTLLSKLPPKQCGCFSSKKTTILKCIPGKILTSKGRGGNERGKQAKGRKTKEVLSRGEGKIEKGKGRSRFYRRICSSVSLANLELILVL